MSHAGEAVAGVSVVIPFYGVSAPPVAALQSVACQTLAAREVILVDDASPDPSVALSLITHPWPFDIRVIRHEVNRGPGEARNTGWADATSQYVAFLDADDAWHPEKLAVQIAWMASRPEYEWSAHRCGSRTRCESVKVIRHRELRSAQLLVRNVIATPTVVCRRELKPCFRAGWRACEDLMLWLDWLYAGHRGALIDASLASLGRRPGTPGGLTGMRSEMHRGEIRVIDTLQAEERLSVLAAFGWRVVMWLKYALRQMRS